MLNKIAGTIFFLVFAVSCFANVYTIKSLTDVRHTDEHELSSFVKTNGELVIRAQKARNGTIEIELLSIKASQEWSPNHPASKDFTRFAEIIKPGEEINLDGSVILNPELKEGILVLPKQKLEINFESSSDINNEFIGKEEIASEDELDSKLAPELVAMSLLLNDVPLILEIPDDYSNKAIRSLIEEEYPFVRTNQLRWPRGKSFEVEHIENKTLLKSIETINREEIMPRLSGSEKNNIVFTFDEKNELESARIVRHHSEPNYQSESSIEIKRLNAD